MTGVRPRTLEGQHAKLLIGGERAPTEAEWAALEATQATEAEGADRKAQGSREPTV